MKVEVCRARRIPEYVVAPSSQTGSTERADNVIGGLNTRRGTIVDSEVRDDEFTAIADVALNDMFGYSNQLRGSTQGKGLCPLRTVSSAVHP